MARALPAAVIDCIRDGVPAPELRANGDKAVFRALVSTAASASQRGWERWQWQALVEEAGSRLGTQARLREGTREQSARSVARTMVDAWNLAMEWVKRQPAPMTRADAIAHAERVRDWASDPEVPLSDNARLVLSHAAAEAARLGTDRPTLPRREALAKTALGLTAHRTILRHLEEAGLLVLEVRGRPSGSKARTRRANAYRLPSTEAMNTYLYRETRSVVPPAQVCGAPENAWTGAGHSSVVPPIVPMTRAEADSNRLEVNAMITLTRNTDGSLVLEAPEHTLEQVLAAIRAVAGPGSVAPEAMSGGSPEGLPPNVKPLRPVPSEESVPAAARNKGRREKL